MQTFDKIICFCMYFINSIDSSIVFMGISCNLTGMGNTCGDGDKTCRMGWNGEGMCRGMEGRLSFHVTL